MLSCLFWNLQGKDLSDVLVQAAEDLLPDIFIFCESKSVDETVFESLVGDEEYFFSTGYQTQRFHIHTSFPSKYLGLRYEADRFLIYEVRLPAREPFLLMVLHGPSKASNWSTASQALESAIYISSLKNVESDTGIYKSVIVGDFNMNPFDPGMISAAAFNAVMDSRQARKKTRKVQGIDYRIYYNPMWNLYGDSNNGPPATLFYRSSTHEELHWHMLDQVIVSPEFIDLIKPDRIKIIDSIGDIHLLTNSGRPNKNKFSDHLPLYFELEV